MDLERNREQDENDYGSLSDGRRHSCRVYASLARYK